MKPRYTDDEIVAAFEEHGSAGRVALALKMNARNVHERAATIEGKRGIKLREFSGIKHAAKVRISRDNRPNPIEVDDAVLMIGSDCHYWPGDKPAAHRAFVKLAKELKPQIVCINGDEFDGATISRHGRIGWETRPTVQQEVAALQECMGEIKAATPGAHHLGSYGNHTLRWDTYLSGNAPALENLPGTRFEDLLPGWNYAWAWMLNGHTLIKHRLKGGIHATWNNTAEAQVNTVTGHLHNLRVTPRSTMSPVNGGNIYGIDTGMMADPWGSQFAYCEQGPRNWRAGFAVLTIKNGLLMPPELVQVIEEDAVFFRGNRIEV